MKTFHLDYALMSAADGRSWTWDVRHAVEGVQIFGGIGSGKTSGSGRTIALRYLKAGFGGLVLTVKPDEKKEWIEYCRLSNRSNDLVILEPGSKNTFNFLQYESEASDSNRALTENIVDVLKTVIKAGESEGSDKSDDAFWQNALDMLLFNVIDLCKLAYNKVTIDHLYNIVQTLPKAVDTKKAKSDNQKDRTNKALGFDVTYSKAHENINKLIDKVETHARIRKGDDFYILSEDEINAIPEVRLFEHIDQFFTDTFRNLSEKTRAIIEFTFTGFLFRLMRDPIYGLFSSASPNVTPDDSLNGKIILVNLPVKVFHKVGRDCQILFKYIWQRAMEKRSVTEYTRPVFLWADEAQNFIHEHDAVYQATARSSKIATVYITQNLPNYYAAMGGEKGEYKVKSFLGTLGTKIFHSNADIETNKYSSELIGDVFNEVESKGITTGSDSFSQSRNTEKRLERAIRPEEFVGLQTGGEKNGRKVGCIMHRQGEPFKDGKNFVKTTYSQTQS